jgi:hypothetical protein
MSKLIALDVAILPPPEVALRAIRLSAALHVDESQGLRLSEEYRPHLTLTQQFVRADELDSALMQVEGVLHRTAPLTVRATGGAKRGKTVWIGVEPTDALARLHAELMDVLEPFERAGGTAAAFVDGDARAGDVIWVGGYREKSSLTAFAPHITLAHASEPPTVEPFAFEAAAVAACHLGRFCSCRRVLRLWTLS